MYLHNDSIFRKAQNIHTGDQIHTQHDAKFKFISVSRWRGAAQSWAVCVRVCFVLSISAVLAVFGEKDRGSTGFDHVASKLPLPLSFCLTHTLTHTDTSAEGAEVSMVLQSQYYHCSLNQITQAVISFFSEVLFKSKFTSYMTISRKKNYSFFSSLLVNLSFSLTLFLQSSCE